MTYEAEPWPILTLQTREDGTGWLEGRISSRDILFFAKFFISLGHDVTIKEPSELVGCIKSILSKLSAKYG